MSSPFYVEMSFMIIYNILMLSTLIRIRISIRRTNFEKIFKYFDFFKGKK